MSLDTDQILKIREILKEHTFQSTYRLIAHCQDMKHQPRLKNQDLGFLCEDCLHVVLDCVDFEQDE